jgi:predicted RNase H-like nuclease (RuvC/YqgF family)
MCQLCVDAAYKYFPVLKGNRTNLHTFLWAATPYPFACGEDMDKIVAGIAQKSNGDWQDALRIAEEETEAAMNDFALHDFAETQAQLQSAQAEQTKLIEQLEDLKEQIQDLEQKLHQNVRANKSLNEMRQSLRRQYLDQ